MIRVLTMIALLFATPAWANQCGEADKEIAAYWDNYYAPENAYAFGAKIQEMVRDKDLSGLFSLVKSALKNGPTNASIADKSFEEIFSEDWVSLVLSEDAPCSPTGYRGFMLGHGMIWFNKSEAGWTIIAINGALK